MRINNLKLRIKKMKIKYLYVVLTIFLILSCSNQDELMVKDLADNEVNILESKKDKIIIISNNLVCHDCVMRLNDYIAKNYNLSKYDYYLLFEDSHGTPGRRIALETYKNEYTPDIKKMFFTAEDSIVQKRLSITKKMFQQSTPYIVYIHLNKKPIYFSYQNIFDSNSCIKESFSIE